MRSPGTTLKDFYRAELAALRDESLTFSVTNPAAAHTLGLSKQQTVDPQAELLLQSFAYLTGRLKYQMELDEAALPNSLLGFLHPHLEAPIPSMLIAKIAVKPDGANFSQEQVLARGRYVSATASNGKGGQVECRFRTCYDTPLVPLTVTDVTLTPLAEYGPQMVEKLAAQPALNTAHSILRVGIRTTNAGKVQTKGLQRLRFHVSSSEENAFKLYEMLSLNLVGVAVQVPAGANSAATIALAPQQTCRWLGFDNTEAMLEASPHTHPGYRLLQEYFAFRDKYLFFEISQLDFSGAQDCFDLLFLLDSPMDKSLTFKPHSLQLNCVPLINLFAQRIEPTALDHADYELHLQGDIGNHRYCEIHSLQALESVRPDGSPREIVPYFSLSDAYSMDGQDYFYVTRREYSRSPAVVGTEMYASVVDSRFDLTQMVDEVLGGKALCTNRNLPEQLRAGDLLQLEGAGPVNGITVLGKPTAHQTPDLVGARPWALVSQLSLNHLSLSEGPQALEALKEILRLHVGANRAQGLQEIDGLRSLAFRRVIRRPDSEDAWRGFVRGMHIHLNMDRGKFDDGSPILFCSVLRHFFSLYATVNNLVEVSVETQNIQGRQKQQWQVLAGAKTAL